MGYAPPDESYKTESMEKLLKSLVNSVDNLRASIGDLNIKIRELNSKLESIE